MRKNEILCIFDDCKQAIFFMQETIKQISNLGIRIEKVDKWDMSIETENWRIVCTYVNGTSLSASRNITQYFYDGMRSWDSKRIFSERIKYTLTPWAEKIKDRHTLIKILTRKIAGGTSWNKTVCQE